MMPLGPQFTKLFNITDAQFGLLVSAYTLSAGISGFLSAFYIDRFERKRLLFILYLGFALSTLACGLSPSYSLLMIARIAAGAFGGVLGALIQTMVADFIPYERRGRAMGLIMGAFSLSTVAGVPASLWLATHFSWHLPFVVIAAMSVALLVVAFRSIPSMDDSSITAMHERKVLSSLKTVLSDRNHWTAFALSILIVLASFCIIPFITIYSTVNVGIKDAQIPMIYLAGGIATFFTARLWGWLTDRWGKVHSFRLVALLSILPMMALTHLPVVPLALYLVVTTLFFVFVSGRMVPGMAIIASAAQPEVRGTFMSLQSCLQSAGMGVASLLGGLLISRSPTGQVLGYGYTGWVGLVVSLAAIWLVGKVRLPQEK